MSTGYKISEKEEVFYLTFQIVGWVDISPLIETHVWKVQIFLVHLCRNTDNTLNRRP